MIDLLISPMHFTKNIRIFNIWFIIFYLLLTFQKTECDIDSCISDKSLDNSDCFNNIIKFEDHKYRAGQFVTTKDGELIIEYSEDATDGRYRLFYRLTKEGRGYYEGDNPIKEIYIDNLIDTKDEDNNNIKVAGRYEARNALIVLDGDTTGKEYLLSTSTWYSLTELYDIESGDYFTWLTPDFWKIGTKYIFSYHYVILRQPNTYYYYLIYTQYLSLNNDGKAQSESYFIRKFKLNFFNESIPYDEIKYEENPENENDRIVSAFIMESHEILVIFFLKEEGKLMLKIYDYNLDSSSSNDVLVEETYDYQKGNGVFFKALNLDDEYIATIFYVNYIYEYNKYTHLKLFKYEGSSFTETFYKKMDYSRRNGEIILNEFYKINSNRLIFATKDDKLYIYLFDFFDSYTKIIVNVYECGLDNYGLTKDMSLYYFNNYIYFTATVENNPSTFSYLITFGYSNGEDSVIDISPYLSDSNNTNVNLNIFDYCLHSSVIDNNIFNYSIVDQVKFVSIPPELKLYLGTKQLKDGDVITSNDSIILQNADLTKTYQRYSLYYQLYVREPIYDYYIKSANTIKYIMNNDGTFTPDDSIKEEYENRAKYPKAGKSIKVEFKLCHEFCEECKIIGTSIHYQYCTKCLEPYRYEYWNYFDVSLSNCLPEGYYNDRETGKVEQCTFDNSKFYYNTTDGKKYCFKYDYDCPPPYPYLNETTHECLNISLPIETTMPNILTTIPAILTTIPIVLTTIPITIPPTIPTTIPIIIPTTIQTTLSTTIPATIPIIIPTTLPTEKLTTIPQIIPSTIILSSTQINILTTIPEIQTTIPEIQITLPEIQTTIPEIPIITTIKLMPTTIPEPTPVPAPTIPRVRCTYFLLIEGKCDFTNDTNTQVYDKLKNEVVETYPEGGHSAGVEIKDGLYFQLTTFKNQMEVLNGTIPNTNNLSIIDLGECADILIKENNLREDTDLIILKLENTTLISNEKSIQYEIYAPGQSQKLDLSVCSKTKIDILYPIELDEETKKIYDDLKSQGYDLFDKNSKFYKDICTPYKSEDGTDVILADRNNDFFAKHEIICQSNCDYSSYSTDSSFVNCQCNVVEKERIEAEEPKRVTSKNNIDSFVDILKYSNYKVLWCYKLVFRGVTFYKNLGSIFSMIYFIGYLISFGFFIYQGIAPLKIEISKLFKKKRDIKNVKSTNQNISNIFDLNNNKNKKQNKEVKVNIVSNVKLKELIDADNQKKEENKVKIRNNVISDFKNDNLVNSNIALTNNKSNLKRSIKNQRNKNVKIIGNNNEIKDKEKIERDRNITYSKDHKNIAIKSYRNNNIKTKTSKEQFPPKRKNELINSDDKSSNNNLKSENKLNEDIIIHKTKLSHNKDISSAEKKSFTKEDLLIKEEQKDNINLNDEKGNTKDILITETNKAKLTDYEINHLDYFEALNIDDRIFLKIYWSLLKREHPIIFTFLAWNDYNLFFIKLSKFFFLIATVMALDALFFSNDAIHTIYTSGGSYKFGSHIVQMVLTIIVYEVLQVLLNYLTLTDIDYYKIKAKKDTITQKEVIDIINCIKYKIIGFYIFTFLVFLFYWYLNSAFCAVYEHTQSIFVVDSIICFIFALIYPLVLYLIPTGLRKISFISQKTKFFVILYKISQWIPIF